MFRVERGRIVNESGMTLFERAVRPVGFFARMRGLLGRPPPTFDEAWLFERCSAVHTIGMRVAIDVVHLDQHFRVICVRHALAPTRASLMLRKSRHVLELAAGAAGHLRISPGQTLRFLS